jgi:hypothetical protein
MDLVALHRERDDAGGAARRAGDGAANDEEERRGAQRRGQLDRPQRNLDGGMPIVCRSRGVGDVAPAGRLATGARPPRWRMTTSSWVALGIMLESADIMES